MEQHIHNMNGATCTKSMISWSAIFSGLFSTAAIGALFALLGMGIGFALFPPDDNLIKTISISAAVWVVVTGTIALFMGGFLTASMSKTCCVKEGMMHGLVLWGVSFIFGLFLTGSGANSVMTGTGELVGQALQLSGQAMSSLVPNMDQVNDTLNIQETKVFKRVSQQTKDLISRAKEKADQKGMQGVDDILNDSDSTQDDLKEAIKNYMTNTDPAAKQKLVDQASQQLVEATGITPDEAQKLLQKWQKSYQDAVAKAKEKADELKDQAKEAVKSASTALSAVALAAFLSMMIGALAAMWGGAVAVRCRQKQDMQRTR